MRTIIEGAYAKLEYAANALEVYRGNAFFQALLLRAYDRLVELAADKARNDTFTAWSNALAEQDTEAANEEYLPAYEQAWWDKMEPRHLSFDYGDIYGGMPDIEIVFD